MFIRSLLSHSAEAPKFCTSGRTCPDVLELDSGDFAVIGADITAESLPLLPAGSGCDSHERVVRIPRELLVRIRSEIPEKI
jgi:hypothetical protein